MNLDNKLVYNNTAGIDILNVHLMLTKATSPEEGLTFLLLTQLYTKFYYERVD